MTKKITRIVMSIIALLGFILSLWHSISSVSPYDILNRITVNGIGTTAPFLKQSAFFYTQNTKTNQKTKLPYTYINLPSTSEVPLAISLYDSLVEEDEESEIQEGQDVPPPTQSEPVIPDGEFPVVSLDMSEGQTPNNLTYKNQSNYTPDINTLAQNEYPLKLASSVSTNSANEPIVLIMHTHGTECYLPEGKISYSDTTPTRNQDATQNVVAVGKKLAETLTNTGIPTVHCETMFDSESYSSAYTNSEKAVIEYLKKYPSIQYVFDVHRDSIVKQNKEKVKTVTEINEKKYAQAMFVVGTDSSGANHPNWEKNLTVASIFQYALVEKYPSLMRPLNLRAASFNAEHAVGSVLIEIGTCGNYLSEAKNTAELLGNVISEIILKDGLG